MVCIRVDRQCRAAKDCAPDPDSGSTGVVIRFSYCLFFVRVDCFFFFFFFFCLFARAFVRLVRAGYFT